MSAHAIWEMMISDLSRASGHRPVLGDHMRNIQVGSINGDNNQLNQNNVTVKNVNNYRGSGGNKGGKDSDGDEGIAILFFMFVAVVVSAFLYLKYHEPIFFWMKVGIGLGCFFHGLSIAPQWKGGCNDTDAMLHCCAGIILAGAQAFVLFTTLTALPTAALEIAAKPTVAVGLLGQAKEVWDRFNPIGQRLIIENMLSALTLAPAILLNVLYGCQHFSQLTAQNYDGWASSLAARTLYVFKSRGSIVSGILTFAAYACVTGWLGRLGLMFQ